MEKGEAPDEEAEKTWLKMLRDQQRRKGEKIQRAEVLKKISLFNVLWSVKMNSFLDFHCR